MTSFIVLEQPLFSWDRIDGSAFYPTFFQGAEIPESQVRQPDGEYDADDVKRSLQFLTHIGFMNVGDIE